MGEGTFAGTRGNDENAPKAAICARRNELAWSTQSWPSSSGARWLIVSPPVDVIFIAQTFGPF
jgi:hypothetical protein